MKPTEKCQPTADQKPVTTSRMLIHNTLYNIIALVVNAVIGFMLIGFFLDRLGPAAYGVWLLLGGSIFRYGGMLNMGLNSAVNRYVPVYLVSKDYSGIQRVISTSLVYFTLCAAVLALCSCVVCWKVESWFEIRPDLIPSARGVILIVGLGFAVSLPFQVYTAVLSGLQRYDIMNLAALCSLSLRTVLLVVLMLRGHGLLTMGIIFGGSEIAVRAVQYLAVRRLLPAVRFSVSAVSFRLFREMLAYGINTFMYGMGAVLISYASYIVIGVLIGDAEVSRFSIATAAVLLLSQLLTAFTRAVKPAVSDLDARSDQGRVKEIAFLTQKYSLLVIIPAVLFFIVMGREFLQVWVGKRFPDAAMMDEMGVLLTVLAVGHFFRLAQHGNFLVLVGRGEHRVFGLFTAVMALLCVGGSVICVHWFGLGLTAIAWSNCVPMVLISGLMLPAYFNWKMKISWRQCILRTWLPAVLGCLPASATMLAWQYFAPPQSWGEIVQVILVTVALIICGGWLFSLKRIERSRFLRILRPAGQGKQ